MKMKTRSWIAVTLTMQFSFAQDARPAASKLGDASLEELLNIEVVSVSRKEQKLSQVAAAAYVITSEEIRRSGATNLPEALRLAPGIQANRLDLTDWAVTSRGFNARNADKLLVLVDGRPIYTPIFSGVLWNYQDVPLEDIDRIEVIRGPGATMWGANAVNGVINIVTMKAQETLGTVVTAGTGSDNRAFLNARYGGRAGERFQYRFTSKTFRKVLQNGDDPFDKWTSSRLAFRSDATLSDRDSLMVEGDILDSRIHDGYEKFVGANPGGMIQTDLNSRPAAGFLMGKWVRKLSDTSEFQLQSYVSRAQVLDASVGAKRDDIDIQFQHSFLRWNQRFLWGLEARAGRSRFNPRSNISFDPLTGEDHLGAMFLQDEIELRPTFHLTIGAKYEHNNYTGAEIQPSAQIAWTPTPTRTWWASVGRAVRAPSQVDTSLDLNFTDSTVPDGLSVHIAGNPRAVSETLLAYESGYRIQMRKRVSFDVAAFYNIYKHLRTAEPRGIGFEPSPWPHGVILLQFDGKAKGSSKGIEVSSNWKVTSSWRLAGSYSWLNLRVIGDPDTLDTSADLVAGESPKNQAQVRSYWEVTRKIQFDAGYTYSGSLPAQNLPSYGRLNARLALQLTKSLEIAASVDNALNHKHYEFRSARDRSGYQSERFGRSEQVSMTWRF